MSDKPEPLWAEERAKKYLDEHWKAKTDQPDFLDLVNVIREAEAAPQKDLLRRFEGGCQHPAICHGTDDGGYPCCRVCDEVKKAILEEREACAKVAATHLFLKRPSGVRRCDLRTVVVLPQLVHRLRCGLGGVGSGPWCL